MLAPFGTIAVCYVSQAQGGGLPSVLMVKLLLELRSPAASAAELCSSVQLGWFVRYTASGVDTMGSSGTCALMRTAALLFLASWGFDSCVSIARGEDVQAPMCFCTFVVARTRQAADMMRQPRPYG